jgi:hypothetical protein
VKCFPCLVEYQGRDSDWPPALAEYVYKGQSLCGRHVNTVRGHAADFDRYPAPEKAEQQWTPDTCPDRRGCHRAPFTVCPRCGWSTS